MTNFWFLFDIFAMKIFDEDKKYLPIAKSWNNAENFSQYLNAKKKKKEKCG